jgi:CHAT domain-containing protein
LVKKISASVNLNEPIITFADLVSKLQPTEAIVDIVHCQKYDKQFTEEGFYAALITKKGDTAPKAVVLENGKDLDTKYFKNYRNCIQSKKADKYSYEQYWKKIDEALTGKTKIFVSLDGVYNQVSLNTFQKPDGKYVVDDKSLVFLTNTKDLVELKSGKKPTYNNQALLVGFPDYGTGGKIPALPGTKKEVEDITKILTVKGFKVNKIMGKQAQEAELKKLKSGASPRIVHIATHGFFLNDLSEFGGEKLFGIDIEKAKENPLLRSGLMLANAEASMDDKNTQEFRSDDNGILTAYEAMNLGLDGTEIVVMSACETGLGDVKAGEGVYGLQRAFHIAGADAILMSLWTVSDAATQRLMTLFNQNLSPTVDKATAFKKAMLQLKTEFKEPYFWGAFVLIGS